MIHRFYFAPTGRAVAIYDDRLRNVMDVLGTVTVRRASTVEPDEHGNWIADLAPVSGPALPPCRNRADALQAEVEWLNDHLGELRGVS